MTIVRDALCDASDKLALKGILESRMDAEILLAHVLQISRMNLYMNMETVLESNHRDEFLKLIQHRQCRVPAAYLIGFQDFMGQRIMVNEQVLIPRPETECMVEYALDLLKNEFGDVPDVTILDAGTGSGAIACACAADMPRLHVVACDTSMSALKVARQNVDRLSLADTISLFRTDTLSCLYAATPVFDMVISNPPYIKTEELASLQEEVRHEPVIALDGGLNGTDMIDTLIEETAPLIKRPGYLILEIDPSQSAYARERLQRYNANNITILKDYAGYDRIVSAQFVRG